MEFSNFVKFDDFHGFQKNQLQKHTLNNHTPFSIPLVMAVYFLLFSLFFENYFKESWLKKVTKINKITFCENLFFSLFSHIVFLKLFGEKYECCWTIGPCGILSTQNWCENLCENLDFHKICIFVFSTKIDDFFDDFLEKSIFALSPFQKCWQGHHFLDTETSKIQVSHSWFCQPNFRKS